MADGASKREVEIKLALADAEEGAWRLRESGFAAIRQRERELNTLYDWPDGRLRQHGYALRIRACGGRHTLTFKGQAEAGVHHAREELEVEIAEGSLAEQILERLGLRAAFRYEKFRTEYQRAGEEGIATLDETPLGVFLELEGEPDWIDKTAADLGFPRADYILKSYVRLQAEACAARGAALEDLLFGEHQGFC